MFREIPASPAWGKVIAKHMSTKRPGWGFMVAEVGNRYGVYTIGRIDGHLTAHMFDHKATEAEAREVANREWVGMGL